MERVPGPLKNQMELFEKTYIKHILSKHDFNFSRAAKSLGLAPKPAVPDEEIRHRNKMARDMGPVPCPTIYSFSLESCSLSIVPGGCSSQELSIIRLAPSLAYWAISSDNLS